MTLAHNPPSLVDFAAIKPVVAISGWQDFLQEGEAFLKTGVNAYAQQRAAFTPEILYNIIAMAIEKLVMAALMKQGSLPYNHTMADLVEAMEETFPGALADLKKELLHLDSFQEICALDSYNITPPDREEIPAMLNVAQRVQELVHQQLTNPRNTGNQ